MNIGDKLKLERINLGLTQAEMCKDVISASYYAKIERGIHRINAEDLLIILQKNNINIDSFFSAIERKDDSNVSYNHLMNMSWNEAYLKQDIPKLKYLRNSIKDNKNVTEKEKKLFSSLIEVAIAEISNNLNSISSEVKKMLQDYIFNLPQWNTVKLSIYGNVLEIYSLKNNMLIIEGILKNGIKNYQLSDRTIILTILLNFIKMCIEEGMDQLAYEYLSIINTQPTFPENMFQKLMAKYYQYLLDVRNNKTIDYKDLNAIYNAIKLSGLCTYSDELQLFFELNMTSYKNV